MHEPHETPVRAVGNTSELRSGLLLDCPMVSQHIHANSNGRAEREHTASVASGQLCAGWRGNRGDRYIEERVGVRPKVQSGIVQREPIRFVIDWFIGGEKLHHNLDVLLE